MSSISIAKGRDKPRCRRAPAIVGKKHDIGVVTYEISSGFEASAELRPIDRRRGGIIRAVVSLGHRMKAPTLMAVATSVRRTRASVKREIPA